MFNSIFYGHERFIVLPIEVLPMFNIITYNTFISTIIQSLLTWYILLDVIDVLHHRAPSSSFPRHHSQNACFY